jgi:large subunit ribosomal protein L10
MDRNEKEAFVTSLRSELEDAGIVIVTRQSALTVSESTDLRIKMRDSGAAFKIAKNTLARIAINGLPCESLKEHLTGPTGVAYSKDPIAAAKVVAAFSKGNDKMQIICGVMGGTFLDAKGIQQLATLPSLDELRGKLIGLLQAPATKLAGLAQAPAAQLARVFSAYGSKST